MSKEKQLPTRAQVQKKDRWDLSGLYADDAAWEREFAVVHTRLPELAAFRGTLADPAKLRALFDLETETWRLMGKLSNYASRNSDVDTTNSHYLGLTGRVDALRSQLGESLAFTRPELLALSAKALDAIAKDERLAPYRFTLEQIVRMKPHTLSANEEKLLALSSEMAMAPYQAFGQLNNADLVFGSVRDSKGRSHLVSHGSYLGCLSNSDRVLRSRFFQAYYAQFRAHKHTLASMLASGIKRDVFYAKARGFSSARASALFDANIPEGVYDELTTATGEHLPHLHRYYDLRRRVLGLKSIHFYDLFVPMLPGLDCDTPYDDAVGVLERALAPLGKEYTKTLTAGLRKGWVDRYENKGKRAGAYSAGCYDSAPFILMNYNGSDSLDSMFTLAHEAGHSMHSKLANTNQPPQYADYSIFVAEVASTFNEALVAHYLFENSTDPRMRAHLLSTQIDDLRGTLFRQTMFAEFEHALHRRVESNESLALDDITGLYRGILARYFGPAFSVDEELELECLRIPHFYYNHYVFQYATGISAATALSRAVIAGDKAATKAYLGFLAAGGSNYPIEVLRSAGVDMSRPDAVRATLTHFGELVTRLEIELAALGVLGGAKKKSKKAPAKGAGAKTPGVKAKSGKAKAKSLAKGEKAKAKALAKGEKAKAKALAKGEKAEAKSLAKGEKAKAKSLAKGEKAKAKGAKAKGKSTKS